MKPSQQTCAVGYWLHERMLEAGFPAETVLFLPGKGEVVGRTLVEHPLIAQIAFTGSREVGLGILEKAAVVRPGQRPVWRTNKSGIRFRRVGCALLRPTQTRKHRKRPLKTITVVCVPPTHCVLTSIFRLHRRTT